MTKKQHVAHVFAVLLTALAAVLVEALAPTGALGHYEWSAPALAAVVYAIRAFGAGPPTAVAIAVGALLLLSLNGCSTLGPTPPPGTPGFVNCSDAALHQAALNILPSAETAIAQANYEAAVAALIAGIGGPLAFAEVACALQWIANEAALQETATGDPLEALKAAHARAWLAAHPVAFQ